VRATGWPVRTVLSCLPFAALPILRAVKDRCHGHQIVRNMDFVYKDVIPAFIIIDR
jgi:hypothetical protein